MSSPAHSICVFCGSRSGNDPAYIEVARGLGARIASEGWELVYGAGDVGLMGAVAEAAIAGGAKALGVIPTHLVPHEKGRTDLSAFVVTETMHERKKVMFMNATAIAVLPGGAGSLDEFFEVLTWAQLGLHKKPLYLVDVAGYWQPLLALIDHVIAEGFADESLRDHITVVPDAAALAADLRARRSARQELAE